VSRERNAILNCDWPIRLLLRLSQDPHADSGALTPSADWVNCCFY